MTKLVFHPAPILEPLPPPPRRLSASHSRMLSVAGGVGVLVLAVWPLSLRSSLQSIEQADDRALIWREGIAADGVVEKSELGAGGHGLSFAYVVDGRRLEGKRWLLDVEAPPRVGDRIEVHLRAADPAQHAIALDARYDAGRYARTTAALSVSYLVAGVGLLLFARSRSRRLRHGVAVPFDFVTPPDAGSRSARVRFKLPGDDAAPVEATIKLPRVRYLPPGAFVEVPELWLVLDPRSKRPFPVTRQMIHHDAQPATLAAALRRWDGAADIDAALRRMSGTDPQEALEGVKDLDALLILRADLRRRLYAWQREHWPELPHVERNAFMLSKTHVATLNRELWLFTLLAAFVVAVGFVAVTGWPPFFGGVAGVLAVLIGRAAFRPG